MPITNKSDAFDPQSEAYRAAKKIARNTWRYELDGNIITRLHLTNVVTRRGRKITLDSGGWKTVTTKDRMNSALSGTGYCVISERGTWYVVRNEHEYAWDKRNPRTVFFDGMTLPDAFNQKKGQRVKAHDDKLRKQIAKLVARVRKGELPEPAQGDCWGCYMVADDGSRPMGKDCVLSHIHEGYLHGSLILRAIESRGYRMPSLIFSHPDLAARALQAFLKKEAGLPA